MYPASPSLTPALASMDLPTISTGATYSMALSTIVVRSAPQMPMKAAFEQVPAA